MAENNDGKSRTDVPYVWPRTLRIPPYRLIYLDLNHWIELAKSYSGHRDGKRNLDILDACCKSVRGKAVVFVISDSIYMEVNKIRSHRQRQDLRRVIELISRYSVVTSRLVIATHEIEAILDKIAGPNPRPINTMDYLDWGVMRAFGLDGRLRILSSHGEDVTTNRRDLFPGGPLEFDEIVRTAYIDLNRKVLEGPAPSEEIDYRLDGWNPNRIAEACRRRAAQENEQTKRFESNPRWRRGRIRDVIAAREILIEINQILWEACNARGVTLADIVPEIPMARQLFDSMPSFDVSVTLKASYHRDPMHRWTQNDIYDIDEMASTIPYCNVVLTDKAMLSHVRRSRLDKRLNTIVLASLKGLRHYL